MRWIAFPYDLHPLWFSFFMYYRILSGENKDGEWKTSENTQTVLPHMYYHIKGSQCMFLHHPSTVSFLSFKRLRTHAAKINNISKTWNKSCSESLFNMETCQAVPWAFCLWYLSLFYLSLRSERAWEHDHICTVTFNKSLLWLFTVYFFIWLLIFNFRQIKLGQLTLFARLARPRAAISAHTHNKGSYITLIKYATHDWMNEIFSAGVWPQEGVDQPLYSVISLRTAVRAIKCQKEKPTDITDVGVTSGVPHCEVPSYREQSCSIFVP